MKNRHFLRFIHSTTNNNYHFHHCGRRHHSLIHRGQSSHRSMQPAPVASSATSDTSAHAVPSLHTAQGKDRAFLGTCQATVDAGGRRQKARALMDSGSSMSFITNRLVQQLKARKIRESTQFTGVSQLSVPEARYKVDLELIPSGDQPPVRMRAVVLDTITGDLPSFHLQGVRKQPFLQGLALADPQFDQPGSVDLLFGMDVLDEVLQPGRVSSPDKKIHAWETIYGWSLRGKCQPGPSSNPVHLCRPADQDTDDLLKAFFEIEQAPDNGLPLTDEGQQALDHFRDTHERTVEGRYVVRLPKRDVSLVLGCSRDQAIRRYHQNKKSLERKGRYSTYEFALQEYGILGHAEPVPPADLRKPESQCYYLPAHGVVKDSSTTTKLRVVFDASARTTTGVALNDVLLPGPNLYPLLTTVMLAFRMHPIGMSADISKMFRVVGLHLEDRDLHRFLQSGSDGGGLKDMRMTRVTFGVTSSPFLATQVLRQLAQDYQDQYPQAASIIMQNFYVDDVLTGASTLEEAQQKQVGLYKLLAEAKMLLRKWKYNSVELMKSIPKDIREEEDTKLFSPPEQCHKALGIHWDNRADTLHVATPTLTPDDRPSKRKIASDVAKTFDLLGWFSPSIVIVKILLQKLWSEKLAWDEPVPEQLAEEWREWRDQLPLITRHAVPRYHLDRGKRVRSLQLHGFSDASDVAYAGVVYLRAVYEDATVSIKLLYSKTRVAPLTGSTTPRLELCGAQLLSKILLHVANALCIPVSDTFAWSDSTITLCWLSTPPIRLKTYVCNRVMDTVGRIPASQWRHVPTTSNPADVASRGMAPAALIEFQLWWQGPPWLLLPPLQWP